MVAMSRMAAAAAVALFSTASATSLRSSHDHLPTQGKPLKEQLPWMKSADELRSEIEELSRNCGDNEITISQSTKMNTADAAGAEVTIDVVRIKAKNAKPTNKAMFVFGEHARELITGEAALGLVKNLCGSGASAEHAKQTLQNTEFVLIPNANPLGRKQVEDGFYCKRTNEDKVDLNRNWSDEHRDTSLSPGDEMYPGTGGFSEPETQSLKDLVDSENPDIYLSVHSGAYLLGMPYGFNPSVMPKPEDETAMMEVLKPISDRYCDGGCPFGNLAEMINYQNPGCDIDYVYEKTKSPYVFTWEIYVGEDIRQRYLAEASERRENGVGSNNNAFLQKTKRGGNKNALSSRLDMEMTEPEDREGFEGCLEQFNPKTPSETETVVQTWSAAFLELCDEVTKKRNATATAAAAATTASPAMSLVGDSSSMASWFNSP